MAKQHQIELFQKNLVPKLSRPLMSQCIKSFQNLIDKGLALERVFLEEGTLTHYQR